MRNAIYRDQENNFTTTSIDDLLCEDLEIINRLPFHPDIAISLKYDEI